MRYVPAIVIGRTVRTLARLRKPGGGSAVPGLVVNKVAPGYLATTLNSFRDGLVIVSGSSGKSTTTKMLVAVLRAHGRSVFTNPSTANISQGLTSALLERADLQGRIDDDIAVLEMDEGHGALIAAELSPRVVALTNVMVDQIDRFHDSEMVAAMLTTIAARATDAVVVNADDDYLVELASSVPAGVRLERFGVSSAVLDAAPHGLGHARLASERLSDPSGIVVGAVSGRTASMLIDGDEHTVGLPARGVHYATDAAAALSTARAVLGSAFDVDLAVAAVGSIPPVFGRGEVVEVRGQQVEFVLVQNPASYQLNIDTLEPGAPVLFAIGSDVRDPSYFWPVDTSRVSRVDIVSGSKAWELALQLSYDEVEIDRVETDLGRAVDDFLALPRPATGVKTIVFSADSMRRTRAHLGLTSEGESA
ncbi:MurT ligase domain-containing protein [Leifsonia sp. YIM 134122]|uniref:Lipid II isoglutaminyl synthase (glutamine-hydrolyzing) subunit MurT n=1 Tax=Leifsonia stereocauli TaxID=3134136 RepID=A0ABU9W1D4_9MICO